VYRVGCAGKIVDATPLPDGKFNIVLVGLREFEIVSEQRERAYRQASVIWRPAATPDGLPSGLRSELMEMAERHMGRFGEVAARELLENAPLDDAALVNFLAFWLDLTVIEKQCLLEAASDARPRRLRDIMEFHLYATRASLAGAARRMH
jgi:Lon protease-like protein